MAIQMRRGLRADFDPYKMLPGEWAVSIDPSTSNQIVWMCFGPGVCKRMGTYEDFVEQVKEATADVKTEYVEEFDKILDEIKVLSSQVSDDKDAVVLVKTTIEDEYLPQIQESLSEIQEKANEAKNSADAAAASEANAKTYAEQAKAVSGEQVTLNRQTLGYNKKNLLKNTAVSSIINEITFTVNDDGSVTANGTVIDAPSSLTICDDLTFLEIGKKYILSGIPNNPQCFIKIADTDGNSIVEVSNSTPTKEFTYDENMVDVQILIRTVDTVVENEIFYPMIRSAEITDGTYEPYVDDVDTRFNAVETEIEEIPDTYATKEELEGYLPLTGGTVSGETNINGITIKNYYLPDNSGWTKYFLMFDITSWYTSTKGSKSGFTGQIFSQRPGGYMREEIAKIIMGVSYKKVDTEDGGQLCLRTTTTGYIPCIVYDSINEKYYLALKIGGSDRVLCFAGCFQGTYLGTFISATDSTGTMPEGYEVVNSDYKIIVEPRATADADGNNIHNTYIPKSSILNEQEEIEANTDENNVAGALALKELSKNMGGLRFGVDSDGNYGYYKDGADTVTPFKSGGISNITMRAMNATFDFTGLKSITINSLSYTAYVDVIYEDGSKKSVQITHEKEQIIDVIGAKQIKYRTYDSTPLEVYFAFTK